MKLLIEAAEFLRGVRRRMLYGDLSREPLRLSRLEVNGEGSTARCDWLLRAGDPWDADLPVEMQQRNRSIQALLDALSMRKLLFQTFPDIHSAQIRVYRRAEDGGTELVMTGVVTREDEAPPRIPSLAMRSQLAGFRFLLAHGVLKAIS